MRILACFSHHFVLRNERYGFSIKSRQNMIPELIGSEALMSWVSTVSLWIVWMLVESHWLILVRPGSGRG